MKKTTTKIFVLGAGCWGTTLASIYEEKGYEVCLWEPDKDKAEKLIETRKLDFFPYNFIDRDIKITHEIKEIIGYDLVLLVTPSQYVRETMLKLQKTKINFSNKIFISCVKGLEEKTTMRPSQIISDVLKIPKNKILVFSGPTHAEEVAQHKPTAITLAGSDFGIMSKLQKLLSTNFLRVYINKDLVGVELGGALKNIFAIACGICDGINLGDNAKAAIISRSLKEMIILGKILGGETKTFFGLSGLGDLITTSYSKYSRNRTFGELLTLKENVIKAQQQIKTTIEGIKTTSVAYALSKKYSLDLPIVTEIYNIIFKNKQIEETINNLFSRKLKYEFENYL